MARAGAYFHLSFVFLIVFTQVGCFKKLGEDRKPSETGDNTFTPFYLGRDNSYIAATAKCQSDSRVQFRYVSDRYGERHDVNEECPESGLVSTNLRVPKGDVNQIITIQVRNRVKNILSVAQEKVLRWSPNLTGFNVTGITGADDVNADIWLVKSNRVPKVNFRKSLDASGYALSIKDAAGAVEICPEVALDTDVDSYEFIGCQLDPATTYQAALTAVNSNITATAALYEFTVDDTDPNPGAVDGITGVSDVDIDTCLGQGRNPTINWSGFTNATDYEVQITDTLGVEKCFDTTSDNFLQLSLCTLDDGGNYKVYVTGRSPSTFNKASSAAFDFNVDDTAPAAPVVGINGLSNHTNNTTPQWIWLPVGGNYRYKLDDVNLEVGSQQTGVASYTPASALDEGYFTLYVQERDACGNWSESGSADVYIDTTAPDAPVVSTSGTNPTSNLTPQWTWTSGAQPGDGTFEAERDGIPVTPGSYEYTPGANLALGSHILKVREKDLAGNWSAWGEYTIVINNPGDPCPPNVSITPTVTNSPRPTWTWTAERASGCNGNSIFRVSIDDEDFAVPDYTGGNLDFAPLTDLSEGVHTLYVQEGDGVGGWSLSGSAQVTIDITPPLPPPTWIRPNPSRTVGTTFFPFVWRSRAGVTKYYVEGFNNGNCSGAPAITDTVQVPTYTYQNLQDLDSYSMRVYSEDNAGNRSVPTACSPTLNIDFTKSVNISEVTVGKDHACALRGGLVYCWGKNNYNQLGTIYGDSVQPQLTYDVGSSAAISAGPYATFSVTSLGLKSWGYGYLGRSSTKLVDWVIPPASSVTAVDAGYEHVCAVQNGGVVCWGKNTNGNLGNNSTVTADTPVAVSGLPASSGVTRVKAGNFHTCALVNGGVKCWGRNDEGQLGDGTQIDRHTPVNVVGLASNVTAIEAADGISCAILNTGELKCWGKVIYGGLAHTHLTPAPIPGFATGTTLVSGASVTGCGIKDGQAYCTGYNGNGQAAIFGNSVAYDIYPVSALPLNSVSKIAPGYDNTCATIQNGLSCWGKFYDETSGGTEENSIPVIFDWTLPSETNVFSDNFTRANSTTLGNGWTESGSSGDATIFGNMLYFDVAGGNLSPIASHTFAAQTTPFVVEFDFTFARTGSDSTYAVYMQLGSSGQMSTSSIKNGIGPNLKWAGRSGTQSVGGMETHEGFGFEQGTSTVQIAQVNTYTHIMIWIDPVNHEFKVLAGGFYGAGTFENNINSIDTIRFMTNNLSNSSFTARIIDNLEIWK